MILKAIKSGISEERIAKVLNIDIATIRQKRDLLNGICKEAAEILKTEHLASNVFPVLRKMKPMRHIEMAELLVTANNFSVPYTKAFSPPRHRICSWNPTNTRPWTASRQSKWPE